MPSRRVIIHIDCVGCGTPVPLAGLVTSVVCHACGWTGELAPDRWRWILGLGNQTVASGEQILGETATELPTCAACEATIGEAAIAAAVEARGTSVACASCRANLPLRPLDSYIAPTQFTAVVGEHVKRLASRTVNIACSNCGAQLVVDGTSQNPACAFCSTHNLLKPEVWRQLHPLLSPFYLWMPRSAARLITQDAPAASLRTAPYYLAAIIPGLIVVALVIGAVLYFTQRSSDSRSSSPRGWGVAGQSCNGMRAACSMDKRAELLCVDGKFIVALTCKGPEGCRLTRDGASASCDYTFADENDPCTVDDLACSTDKKAELRCDQTKFVKIATCGGTDGCTVVPSGKGNTLTCDDHIAQNGDLCSDNGRSACTVDKQSVLTCKGGHFAIAASCHGPTGCRVIPNPSAGTTTIACDRNIAEVDDRCNDGANACSADGTSLLTCRTGRLVVAKRCKACRVIDDAPTCTPSGHRTR